MGVGVGTAQSYSLQAGVTLPATVTEALQHSPSKVSSSGLAVLTEARPLLLPASGTAGAAKIAAGLNSITHQEHEPEGNPSSRLL